MQSEMRFIYSPLMPFTPYDAGSHAIGRARELLQGSRRASSPSLSVMARIDIRRLSLVMAVAALDAYMHRLIVDKVYAHQQLPGGLARLDVSFEQLLGQADLAAVAARNPPHRSRPRVGVKRQLRDRLLRQTFQGFEDVSKALGMAGRRGNWDQIGGQMDPPLTRIEIRKRLNSIVMRRNQIVHEGDYRRLERPRNATRNSLTFGQAKADLEFIAQLIDAIHATV